MRHSTSDVRRAETGTVENSAESRRLAVVLLIGGAIGLAMAVTLLVEKIALIENPDYVPSCSINPVLSCGSVMSTPQAEAIGIPNPVLGVAGFATVATIGAALLAGARFASWFWVLSQFGVTFAVIFVHWLIYQSLYVIGALCPYCIVVWAVTIPIFLYTTTHTLRLVQQSSAGEEHRLIRGLTEYRGAIITSWFLAIAALIAVRFWSYWSSLI